MGAGFVLGESAARAAAVVVGNPIKIDVAAFTLFVGVLGLRIMSLIASERNARVQQRLDRAAQDEELFLVREGVELRASALLHDTVLNNLAAISSSPAGPPSGQLRKGVQHDIEMLVREDWWGEAAKSVNATSSAEWQFSALNASIELMRDMGLAVDVTGDIEVIERLSVEQSATVALAVHQCLVNVMKHAETGKAELVLAESDQEVSVMVVDGGRGFVLANSHGDRLGLRQSVRRRIEAVGGSVRVWSTPGRGTSIVIRIPVDGDST
jgi:signal transduction histidine kinase